MNATLIPGLPTEVLGHIFEYDNTYRERFSRRVLPELHLLFRVMEDIVDLTPQFVFFPHKLDKYVRSLKKKEIVQMVHFTKTPLPKHYKKIVGIRVLIFHVFTDRTSLAYQVGWYKSREQFDFTHWWNRVSGPLY